MAISITVDNDRTTIPPNPPFDPLLLDETAGVQDSTTTDDGDEIDVTLTAGALGGFATAFNTFLNSSGAGALNLTTAQKEYARDHDGASSESDFVLVTTTAGETIDDLFFANSTGGVLTGQQVVGMQTLDGQDVFLWSDGSFGSSSDFCVATTSSTAGAGEVVAAFYLNEAGDHKSAQVQMVVFEPLEHPNAADPDDALNFTDALRVGASGSLSFDFDQLDSSSSLWVAVGNSTEAVLISGFHPIVSNTSGKKTNDSDVIHTSQGGQDATIGVNNQLFDDNSKIAQQPETAVFTLVTGLQGLVGTDAGVLSDYIVDDPTSNNAVEQGVDYSGYIPGVTGAGIFISQDQGSPGATKSLDINVFRTNNATAEDGFGYIYSDGVAKTGNALTDDIAVNVGTVTITNDDGVDIGTWVLGADPDGAGPLQANGATVSSTSTEGTHNVTVTIAGNNIDVNGFGVEYTISWTTLGGAIMNRFHVVREEGAWDVGRVDVARTIPINTAVGDKLFVEDDFPALSGTNASKRVEEDELSVAAADGDLSTGITDGDAFTDEVTFSNADLQVVINAGTDAPATFSLNLSVSGAVKDIDGNAMSSKGDAITWNVNGSVIEAVAAGRIVFTITQTAGSGTPNDPTDDVFTVDLRDQIDHPDASGDNGIETLDLTPAFSAKDADNDPADLNGPGNDQEPIQLVVENDVPALSGTSVSKRVEEDELSVAAADGDLSTGITDGDGFTDEVTYSNADLQAAVTPGADEPVTFDLNLSVSGAVKDIDGNSMTSKGDAMTWAVVGSQVQAVAGGRIIFTITQTAGGATADPADDVFTVDLRDQIDHPDASGDNGIETLDLTPAFVAEDFDGDAVDLNGAGNDQETIQLVVENDVPALSGTSASKRVEEDELSVAAADGDLSTGITDGDAFTDEVTFSNADLQATVTPGADEPVTFDLDLDGSINGTAVKDIDGNAMSSKGDAMTWNVNAGVIEALAGGRIVFTITQTAGGATADPTDDVFRVDLRDQIDHPDASGDNGIETLDLTPAFDAEDFDGDQVDLDGAGDDQKTIQLVVENDIPIISGTVSKRVEEDELSTTAPAPADLSDGITDGDAFTDEVTFSNADLQAGITPGADEPVSFDLNTSVSGAVKDIDGNAMTSKGDAMTWNVNGSVIEAVAGGRVVFTIEQTAGGGTADPADDVFTVDLRDQIDHPDASGDNGIETLDLTPAFVAEDFDGDPVDLNGAGNDQETIQLVVENDVPALSGTSVSKRVEEDELSVAAADGDLSTGITDGDGFTDEVTYSNADLQAAVTPGADEPVTFDLNLSVSGAVKDIDGNSMTSKGDAMTWNVNGSVIEAVAGGRIIFTITQTAGGATADPADDVFTVDLRDQIDHPDASGDNGIETLDLTPAFVAEDFDGDAVDLNGAGNDQETIRLVVENDVPIFNAQIVSQTLDWVDNGFVTGSLQGNPGADEPASYIIDKFTDLAAYTETLSTDGKTLTYSIGATTFFTLALNDAANSGAGSYTFTIHEPLPDQVLELNFQDLASGQNLHGTIAFDKTNINNNGTPLDPSDDFLPDGGLMTFPSNIDINDGEAGESNDGTMTSDSGTTNTSQGGGQVTIGNTNQAFNSPDEGQWFVYVDNPATTAVSGVGLDPTSADDADTIEFNGTVEVKTASVEIVQASGKGTAKSPGPALQVTAYDINPPNVDSSAEARAFVLDPTATGDQSNIIGVKIYDENGVLIEYRTNEDNGATNDGDLQDIPGTTDDSAVVISFILDDNGGTAGDPTDDIYSALVSNLKQNYTIEWETEGDHDAAQVQHVSGSYDIGGFNLLQGQDTPDVDFEFSVAIEDNDGDLNNFNGVSQVFDDFKIKVDGSGVFDDPANVAPTGFVTSYDLI